MGIWDKGAVTKRQTASKASHSSYWLGDTFRDLDLSDKGADTTEIIRLAAVKQSVANFVRIVTNQPIPVAFSSGDASYTDGKSVVISASTKEKEFDSIVGLALHEASHILLSDFDFLQKFAQYGSYMSPPDLITSGQKIGMDGPAITDLLKLLMNIFEDRRIDFWMYKTAPGYRPYYESMYGHYFNSKEIDVALLTGLKREPTVDNFKFYLLNLTNPNFDATHLPGLVEIVKEIDLEHIDRIGASDYGYAKRITGTGPYVFDRMPELFRLAVNVARIIFANAKSVSGQGQQQQQGQGQGQAGKQQDGNKEKNLDTPSGRGGSPSAGQGDADDSDTDDGDSDSDDDSDSDGDDKDNEKGKSKGKGKKGDDADDSDDDADGDGDDDADKGDKDAKGKVNEAKLNKAMKQQEIFTKGDTQKKKLSRSKAQQVKAVEQSGAQMTEIDYNDYSGAAHKTKVVIMRKLTSEIMTSGAYPFVGWSPQPGKLSPMDCSAKAVADGFRAGAILAQRLGIRNQEQVARHNRKTEGHIDRRRLAALGFDDENVFFTLEKTAYKPVFLHLSIYASGSMSSNNAWTRALTAGVALAVAADKIDNLDVVLSIRSSGSGLATISIIYDSRTDNLTKIRTLFPALYPNGSTPEGLTFAALLDDILSVKTDERYFINMSDGQPAHDGYSGPSAWKHTAAQIARMTNEGIKVLSYYIDSNNGSSRDKEAFGKMYGKLASYVKPEQVMSLIATLNRLFLAR